MMLGRLRLGLLQAGAPSCIIVCSQGTQARVWAAGTTLCVLTARKWCRPADLTYLTTWRDIGTARVTCTSGCTCKPELIDAFRAISTSVFINRMVQVSGRQPQLVGLVPCFWPCFLQALLLIFKVHFLVRGFRNGRPPSSSTPTASI